jgi:hypothetical protein
MGTHIRFELVSAQIPPLTLPSGGRYSPARGQPVPNIITVTYFGRTLGRRSIDRHSPASQSVNHAQHCIKEIDYCVKQAPTNEELEILLSLSPGDYVGAYDKTGRQWEGTVEMTHPEQGVVWIHTRHGERKLLHVQEQTIRPAPAPVVSNAGESWPRPRWTER